MHYGRAPLIEQKTMRDAACGGFAPAPPGFSALVPLPMVSLLIAEGGCGSIPQLLSVEASESALGLLPSVGPSNRWAKR
jgi:hypothetical protein